MSDTDSFIDEVSEEVRRDRLFRLMRKWGWLPLLAVLALVSGSAYFEWTKSRDRATAEFLGDEILKTIQLEEAQERETAYDAILTQDDNAALVALLESSDALEQGDTQRALAALRPIADNPDISETYRHLATLKIVLMQGSDMSAAQRLDMLQSIAAPGAPYRLLAEEQMAVAQIAAGQSADALTRLQAILADDQVTTGLRQRVSQLIVALGGDLSAT